MRTAVQYKPNNRGTLSRRPKPSLGSPARQAPSVAEIRKRIGFSQPEFARLVSYSPRAVADWEAGKALDAKARRKVTEIDRLSGALARLMPAGQLGNWLREENDAFGGQPPLALIERGESDRLWQMIHQIDANIAT